MKQQGWSDGEQTACQPKCQINLSSNQVENNWNVSRCSTTVSDWNMVQETGRGISFDKMSTVRVRGGLLTHRELNMMMLSREMDI